MFSCEFWKIFKNIFLYRTPPLTTSVSVLLVFCEDVFVNIFVNKISSSHFNEYEYQM